MSLAVSDKGLRLAARDEDLAAQCAGYSLTKSIYFFHYIVTKFICQLLNSTFQNFSFVIFSDHLCVGVKIQVFICPF